MDRVGSLSNSRMRVIKSGAIRYGELCIKWEERPLVLVVLRDESSEKTKKVDILEFISPQFAKWQLPDEVLFVAAIPKTSVGKFSKKDIREAYSDIYRKES